MFSHVADIDDTRHEYLRADSMEYNILLRDVSGALGAAGPTEMSSVDLRREIRSMQVRLETEGEQRADTRESERYRLLAEVAAAERTVAADPGRLPDERDRIAAITTGFERSLRRTASERTVHTYLLELHKKYAIPLACLAFMALALPAGLLARRAGRTFGFLVGICLCFLYWDAVDHRRDDLAARRLRTGAAGVAAERRRAGGRRRDRRAEPYPMNILQRMLVRAFLPVFAVAAAFFVLILLLVDLYPKLSAFAANEVSMAQIAAIAALYAPTAARFAVPIGLLFAITYTLGTIQARNELIAVLGAGVGLRSFMSPLLLVGLIASPGLLAFDEGIGTPALRAYNERYRAAVGHPLFLNNTDVTVMDGGGRRVYRADYYNDREGALRGLTVVERTADGRLVSRTDAARAEWMDDRWMLYDVRHYRWDTAGERLIQESIAESSDHYAPGPDTFRQESRDVADMTLREGWAWVQTLRRAGLPYRSAQTDLYAKAGFAVTPFVVSVIAAAVGGMLRRNVLLASMLIALIGSVGYFVLQMVAHILAKTDVIPPLLGASLSAMVFLVLGAVLLWRART